MRLLIQRSGIAIACAAVLSCAPSSLVDVPGPSNLVPLSGVTTPSGAQQLYAFAVTQFAISLGGGDGTTVGVDSYVSASGLLTDELMRTGPRLVNPLVPTISVPIDERTMNSVMPSGSASLYDQIQRSRVEAQQARQALALYAPTSPRALQGELYATEGYSVLMFAELFCSGIPLSSVPLTGAPTPTRGYSTAELFTTAQALFDSAFTYGGGSPQVLYLAQVGRGRALMGRGLALLVAPTLTGMVLLAVLPLPSWPAGVGAPTIQCVGGGEAARKQIARTHALKNQSAGDGHRDAAVCR